jgi:hypothetical protein
LDESERLRLQLTFGVAVSGFLVVFVAFAVSVLAFKDSDNPGEIIPAVLGVVTAAVGTLAGLIAGHTAGATGKARAERRAEANEHDAISGRALAHSLELDEQALGDAASGSSEQFGGASSSTEATVVRRHAEMARRMFPRATP